MFIVSDYDSTAQISWSFSDVDAVDVWAPL
jgi:hypothetical protein